MAVIAPILPILGTVFSAVSGMMGQPEGPDFSASNAAAQQSAQREENASKLRMAQEEQRMMRERAQARSETRIKRAQVIQQAETLGVSGASAPAGAVGSIQSTTSGNIGFAESQFQLEKQRINELNQANYLRTQSSVLAAQAQQDAAENNNNKAIFGSLFGAAPKILGAFAR